MKKIIFCVFLFLVFIIAGCSNSSNCNQVFGDVPIPTPTPPIPPPDPPVPTHLINGRLTGVAFNGVVLQLKDENGNIASEIVTDADGNYEFEDVLDGIYTVAVYSEPGSGYSYENVNVTVSGSNVIADDIVLKSLLMNHTYSGINGAQANKIFETSDNCLVVVGEINSVNVSPDRYDTPSDYHGALDIWVLKIDPTAVDKESGILFNHCYGGGSVDIGYAITKTADDCIAIASHVVSSSADANGYIGGTDILVMKIDPSDNTDRGLLFNHCYGGTGYDTANGIVEMSDGCLAVVGYTESINGDVTDSMGNGDIFVLKIDPSDNTDRGLLFNHCYGGTQRDIGRKIIETSDNMLAVVGQTASSDIDSSENHGSNDILVLKIDPSDNAAADRGLLFNHCYGGTGSDTGFDIVETNDNMLAVVGQTTSLSGDGDVIINFGSADILVLKIDPSDNTDRGLLFNHCYGGSDADLGRGITEMPGGILAVVGTTYSNDIDAAGNHAGNDILLLKIDPSDNTATDRGLLFHRCYGGSGNDFATAITLCADGCLAICGYTGSPSSDGDIPSDSKFGSSSYWVFKINNAGNYSF